MTDYNTHVRHTGLGQVGLRFEKKGSGAIVFVPSSADPIAVKASSIHRTFSMGKLSKKLGEYEEGNYEKEIKKVLAQSVSAVNTAEWQKYQEQRQSPKPKHPIIERNQEIAELKANIKQKRVHAFEVLKIHDPVIFRIANRLLQIEQIDELEAIHEAYKKQPKVDCGRPSFETWLRLQGLYKEAEQWRYRRLMEKVYTPPQRTSPSQISSQNVSTEAKAFERYANAVKAHRYRVTCIKMFSDGKKKAFILGKKDGASKGFTAKEMMQNMPQMQRIQSYRENIYYTPLSDDKHHILIDDMTADSVARLRKDGFIPAVILESSPKNYQCVLTIPKVQSPFSREASNRLTEQLNREYGDKKLSGCIHPHRAPGFGNMKPKHQNADGSYPRVKLLHAEKQECTKAYLTARAIAKKYEEQERERKTQSQHRAQRLPQTSATTAYFNHYDDIRHHMSIEDFSRLDAMIAVRMRATGHSSQAVMEAIQECAPAIRTKEGRNWQKYAERTAKYAFGVAGDLALQKLEENMESWQRREGSLPVFQRLRF